MHDSSIIIFIALNFTILGNYTILTFSFTLFLFHFCVSFVVRELYGQCKSNICNIWIVLYKCWFFCCSSSNSRRQKMFILHNRVSVSVCNDYVTYCLQCSFRCYQKMKAMNTISRKLSWNVYKHGMMLSSQRKCLFYDLHWEK